MKSTELSTLISILENAQQDLRPGIDGRVGTTVDVFGARSRIDRALDFLHSLRADTSKAEDTVSTAIDPAVWSEPKKFPPVDEKGSPDLPWLGLPSLSAEDRHRRLEILKVCGNLATAKHWEAWITGTNHENGEVFQ